MNHGRDDVRDEAVARAWREHVRDTPPAAVDDAIRAAARRAVGAQPRVEPVAEAREPWRWWMPLAAAATIGAIAIGVIQSLPQDAVEPTVVSDAIRPMRKDAPAAAAPAQQAAAPADQANRDVAPANPVVASAPAARERTSAAPPESDARKAATVPPRHAEEAPTRQQPLPAPAAKQSVVAPVESKESADVPMLATGKTESSRKDDAAASTDALAKRADADAGGIGRDERAAGGGFVPSPPVSPAVVAQAPASPPAATAAPAAAPAPAGAAGSLSDARQSSNAADAATRAKVRTIPERPLLSAQSASGARAAAEPQAMAVTPPDVFITEIRRLLAAGDREGAVRELQRFRRTHVDADARLPEDLKAFGTSVPR